MNIPTSPGTETMNSRRFTHYTEAEKRAIARAREQYPDDSQRGLAKRLFEDYNKVNTPGHTLCLRSEDSIYAAIRKHDAGRTRSVPVAS